MPHTAFVAGVPASCLLDFGEVSGDERDNIRFTTDPTDAKVEVFGDDRVNVNCKCGDSDSDDERDSIDNDVGDDSLNSASAIAPTERVSDNADSAMSATVTLPIELSSERRRGWL